MELHAASSPLVRLERSCAWWWTTKGLLMMVRQWRRQYMMGGAEQWQGGGRVRFGSGRGWFQASIKSNPFSWNWSLNTSPHRPLPAMMMAHSVKAYPWVRLNPNPYPIPGQDAVQAVLAWMHDWGWGGRLGFISISIHCRSLRFFF